MVSILLILSGIVIILAGGIFFWFLFRKEAEDQPDERFVCSQCNEKDCNCYKEDEIQDK